MPPVLADIILPSSLGLLPSCHIPYISRKLSCSQIVGFSHLMFKLNNIAIVSGYVKILCSSVLGAIFHSVLQSLGWISLTLVLPLSQAGAELNVNTHVGAQHEKGLNLVLHVYL